MINPNWNLSNLPPFNHPDVAEFGYQLFEIAHLEKERLGKPQDFLSNYAMYRGKSGRITAGGRNPMNDAGNGITPVNLYFANIERTVSNITARMPVGEVVDMDGKHDVAETIVSLKLKKWWKDTDQQQKTRLTARMMEIYGITTEKPIRNPNTNNPDILITDPYAFFPAPGNWVNISEDAPYICYAYLEFVSEIETAFNVKNIATDDNVYDLLGHRREEYKYKGTNNASLGNYTDHMSLVSPSNQPISDKKMQKGLIIELWVRDNSSDDFKSMSPVLDQYTQQPIMDDFGAIQMTEQIETRKRCPDGIRKITIARSKDPQNMGWIVLDDCPNPNINYRHLNYGDDVKHTHPWGRLPVYTANSYKDGITIWGFSAAEQVGDLKNKIDLIVSKVISYVLNVMTPPLIVQQHCGITREMITNSSKKAGRLVLMPSTPNARIEFMKVPDLPATFFNVLDLVIKLFDRVYQIEDADRGVNPQGVIAASAIVALQERNQVLMQTKTASIDFLAEQRSKWAIGLWQNWGIEEDLAEVTGEQIPFRMVNYINRKFNYVVESGSTTPRTSLQIQEMAKWLYESKAIGQKGLLEAINWPNYKEEIERTAESQLDQALQILIDAGLPEEYAIQLKEVLMQTQFQAEMPKTAAQGHQPVQPKSLIPPSSNVQTGA
jgi:hypothetical protein